MSVTHSYGKVLLKVNDFCSIITETKGEDGYVWNEVTFKSESDEKEIYIGSYFSYNYTNSNEWMEYNENYIALLKIPKIGYQNLDMQITKLFDINKKEVIQDSQENLLDVYNSEFKGITKNKILNRN